MALVVMCGKPWSGKSMTVRRLLESIGPGREVRIVDDSCSHLDRNRNYEDMTSEKNLRSILRSEVDRSLSPRTIVIIDSLNAIKGYRYELWCLARASGVRYCVLYCAANDELCRARNACGGSDTYLDAVLLDLISRFEQPNRRNRWDSPLFEIDDAPDELIADVAAYLAGGDDTSKTVLRPTIATRTTEPAAPNSLHELDRATHEVIRAVMEAQMRDNGPVNGLCVDRGLPSLHISRPVGMAELSRFRRVFIKLVGQSSLSGPPPLVDAHSAKRMFIDYLNRELRP